MILIDSSVVIALFRNGDSCHGDAVEAFMANDNFLLLDSVLSEVLTVLKMKEGLEISKKCAEFLMNSIDVDFEMAGDEIFLETLRVFESLNNRLSFVDTMLMVYARKNDLQLMTFDKDLGKAYLKF